MLHHKRLMPPNNPIITTFLKFFSVLSSVLAANSPLCLLSKKMGGSRSDNWSLGNRKKSAGVISVSINKAFAR